MAKEKTNAQVLVRFGKVSFGEGTGSVSVRIERQNLDLMQADALLCGRRLAGHLIEARDDEDAKQTNFLKGNRVRIKGSFDVGGFSVRPKYYSATLSFQLSEIDEAELSHLACKTGRVLADHVFDLEAAVQGDEAEEHEESNGEPASSVASSMKNRRKARAK